MHVAAPKPESIRGWDKTGWGKNVAVDLDLEAVDPGGCDALVLRGGRINPDKLRLEPKALEEIAEGRHEPRRLAA